MNEELEGFIKKTVVLIISTKVGDHWKNTEDCVFDETKKGKIIVEPKEKEVN